MAGGIRREVSHVDLNAERVLPAGLRCSSGACAHVRLRNDTRSCRSRERVKSDASKRPPHARCEHAQSQRHLGVCQ